MLGPCLRIPWSTTRIDRDFSVECVFRNAAVTRTRRNHSLRRSDQQMALIIIASMLLLLPSSQSLPLSPRTSLVSHRARLRYSQRLSMSNDEESKAREVRVSYIKVCISKIITIRPSSAGGTTTRHSVRLL
jgi:hypothetical protein